MTRSAAEAISSFTFGAPVEGEMDVSVKDGGTQVEYEDEDPLIHEWFIETLAKVGTESRMAEFMPQLASASKG